MKPIFIIIVIVFGLVSCRDQEEKQIHLGDYNHPDSTEVGMLPHGPDISADSTAEGSKQLDSIKPKDSTKTVPQYRKKKSK